MLAGITLLFMLLALLFIYVYISNGDLIDPGVFFILTWIFSLFVSLFFLEKWDIEISLFSSIVIFTSISIFLLCVLIGRLITKSISYKHKKRILNYAISWHKIIFLVFFIIFSGYIIIDILNHIANETGYNPDTGKLLEHIRYVTTHRDDVNLGRVYPNLLRINLVIGGVCFFVFCNNLYLKINKRNNVILLISIVCLLFTVLSAGRTQTLNLLIIYLTLFLLEYGRNKAWSDVSLMKHVLKWMIYIGLFFILCFIGIGIFSLNRFGGAQGGSISEVANNLGIYISSPIPAFSFALDNIFYYQKYNGNNELFGEHVFVTQYGSLKSLGLINKNISAFLPPLPLRNLHSNVYTAYFRYILDFGIWGLFFIQACIGFLIGTIYGYIKYTRTPSFFIRIFYSLLMYGVLMMFFDEQVFFTLNNIMIQMLFYYLFYKLVLRKLNN